MKSAQLPVRIASPLDAALHNVRDEIIAVIDAGKWKFSSTSTYKAQRRAVAAAFRPLVSQFARGSIVAADYGNTLWGVEWDRKDGLTIPRKLVQFLPGEVLLHFDNRLELEGYSIGEHYRDRRYAVFLSTARDGDPRCGRSHRASVIAANAQDAVSVRAAYLAGEAPGTIARQLLDATVKSIQRLIDAFLATNFGEDFRGCAHIRCELNRPEVYGEVRDEKLADTDSPMPSQSPSTASAKKMQQCWRVAAANRERAATSLGDANPKKCWKWLTVEGYEGADGNEAHMPSCDSFLCYVRKFDRLMAGRPGREPRARAGRSIQPLAER